MNKLYFYLRTSLLNINKLIGMETSSIGVHVEWNKEKFLCIPITYAFSFYLRACWQVLAELNRWLNWTVFYLFLCVGWLGCFRFYFETIFMKYCSFVFTHFPNRRFFNWRIFFYSRLSSSNQWGPDILLFWSLS